MYQYVILKNVIATYSLDEEVRKIHAEILRLRFSSYRKYYGHQSIPTDLFDFIGTHLVITKQVNGESRAVLAYRFTTSFDCDYYGQDFPYIGHMHAKQTDEEKNIVKLAQTFIDSQIEVGYLNAYAVDPGIKFSEKKELMERGFAFYGQYIEDKNIPAITAVTDRFKVYRNLYNMGFRYITGEHKTSTFSAPHIMGEKFRSMILTKQTSYAETLKQRYKNDYLNAVTINCQNHEVEKFLDPA